MLNLSPEQPFTIAILAIGGQGGGVLSNWLRDLAEDNGWQVQTTSVPGVAQRTGATIYYVEMLPQGDKEPVLALMPIPGAVDLVVAAELMEAGRAIQRGLVSSDRTTLIASNHRDYAVSEKANPGTGAVDPQAVFSAAQSMARRFIQADMAELAEQAGSVISASLFGAIAAAGVLPFSRAAYEAVIEKSGLGVKPSLVAFGKGYDAVAANVIMTETPAAKANGLNGGSERQKQQYHASRERILQEFPQQTQAMLQAGLDAVVDFQDAAYGEEYLDRVNKLCQLDTANGGGARDYEFTVVAAKYLARAMTYDDVIRVAGLKTRASRFARVQQEVGAGAEHILQVTEFMHPRLEEICATLPVGLGRAIERRPTLSRWLRRVTDRGRRVRTDSLFWFLLLYLLAGLRRWRRGSLRHLREIEHLEQWLGLACHALEADQNYALAVEILKFRRLIKGYADTHVRGLSKYDKVLSALPLLAARTDAADWIARLRDAALEDEAGQALERLLTDLARFNNVTTKQVA